MKYLTNGYYFFKSTAQNGDNTRGGLSFFRSKNHIIIELLPETLPYKKSSPRLVLALSPSSYMDLPIKQTLRIPVNSLSGNIAAVGILADNHLLSYILPPDSPFHIDDFTWQNLKYPEKKSDPKPSALPPAPTPSPIDFDPFNTTNPSYSWQICPASATLRQKLAEFNITLPTEIAKSAQNSLSTFGHLLFGNYTDETTLREFFILGIPTDSADRSCPYNDKYAAARFVTAANLYGNSPYEGYHLYYVDKKSTAVVKVVVI